MEGAGHRGPPPGGSILRRVLVATRAFPGPENVGLYAGPYFIWSRTSSSATPSTAGGTGTPRRLASVTVRSTV